MDEKCHIQAAAKRFAEVGDGASTTGMTIGRSVTARPYGGSRRPEREPQPRSQHAATCPVPGGLGTLGQLSDTCSCVRTFCRRHSQRTPPPAASAPLRDRIRPRADGRHATASATSGHAASPVVRDRFYPEPATFESSIGIGAVAASPEHGQSRGVRRPCRPTPQCLQAGTKSVVSGSEGEQRRRLLPLSGWQDECSWHANI